MSEEYRPMVGDHIIGVLSRRKAQITGEGRMLGTRGFRYPVVITSEGDDPGLRTTIGETEQWPPEHFKLLSRGVAPTTEYKDY